LKEYLEEVEIRQAQADYLMAKILDQLEGSTLRGAPRRRARRRKNDS
jgi:hypothetical protein